MASRGRSCAAWRRPFWTPGGAVGGFEAWASSALKPGGGLSSSAAFEILVGRIFNALYNGGAFSPEQLARFGQQAENRHFGKPSGLMDQLACALDGAVYIDFAAGEIAPVAAPFADMGLTLSLTDTGGSHAGLTAAYAALPADMCRVARRFGAETLSQVDPADFYAHRQPALPMTARRTFLRRTRACRSCATRSCTGTPRRTCA